MHYIKNNLPLIVSFITGFAVMTTELVASRIVAPLVGNSVYTWTSVIGIILFGLAIGSAFGGKIADQYHDKYLGLQFILSSFFIGNIFLISKHISWILQTSQSILFLNILITCILFLIPAVLLGTIQPVLLKKYAHHDFSHLGKDYGLLSFSWTLGSIVGVFATGFILISFIGTRNILLIISIILFILGFILNNQKRVMFLSLFLAFLLFLANIANPINKFNNATIYEKESAYYFIKVTLADLTSFGNSKILFLDFDTHSVDGSKKSTTDYTEIYPIFWEINPLIKKTLLIGSGAYTLPKKMSDYKKDITISVLEIDPELELVARLYFNLSNYSINTLVTDARIFFNKNTDQKYDLIYGDAYNSFISVPWYLMTYEFNERVKKNLSDGGIYSINFIASQDEKGRLLRDSIIKTFVQSFPNSFYVAFGETPSDAQSITLIGINGTKLVDIDNISKKLLSTENSFLSKKIYSIDTNNLTGEVLTDDFSPTERLIDPIRSYFLKKRLSY